jgi:K+-sensing histidine kinase KdpD
MGQLKRPAKIELIRNMIITVVFLLTATVISYVIIYFGGFTNNIGMVYIMAVVLISRFSNGYIPGLAASFISISCVNYLFTYPYMEFKLSGIGYSITFITLLVISTITSATTTHLKQQSQILNERDKLLMEAEKETMRANLLRAISHDLRTPLTGIIGASSAYLDNKNTMAEEERMHLISNIREDANWLLNMVENLLSVTRIRDTGAHVTKQLEPLEEVVSEALQRFRKRLPNATVHVSVPDDLIMVPMDATLIEQVIINLLENAVYHSNSTEPINLIVSVEDGYASFEVSDQGVGLPADRISTLFDGYTSLPNSSYDSHKGMGIGLSICKTIVVAHNGTIFVSNKKHGAVFTFTLPLGEDFYE